jgi:hypothetical protein
VAHTIEAIGAVDLDCDFRQVSASEDDRFWTIALYGPTRPANYYFVDREAERFAICSVPGPTSSSIA